MRVVDVTDMAALVLPPELAPLELDGIKIVDPELDLALIEYLTKVAHHAVNRMQDRPANLDHYGPITRAMWVITRDPVELALWEPPHDCPDCRDGIRLGIAQLEEDPSKTVAIGTLWYQAFWTT